ncbi:MAG: hypothetical protein DMD28_12210 [Gemmatimonadetes bacterium]|nr:MAG: hypothetical protein DMD28_12210 [Gemmatimonadota bacterium]
MNTSRQGSTELPFNVRQKLLRRSRRRRTLLYLRNDTVWLFLLITMAILVATQLIGALGRA